MKPIKQMLDMSPTRIKRKFCKVTAVFLCGAVLSMSGAAIAQIQQKSVTQSSAPFQVGVHLSRAKPDSGQPDMGTIGRETEDAIAGNVEQPVMTPTRGSFLAKWQPVKGATGYHRLFDIPSN